jgi:hypothetical protein
MAENKEGIQFSHTLEEQIGGQLEAGLILTDVYEDFSNDPDAIADGIPSYWASRAVKPTAQQGDGKKRVLSFATGDQKAISDTCIRARAFIYRNARPLDLARWQHHFENGSKEAVLTALAAYQNEDGGFGHALEPDAWNPNSTPIQTWSAMEILREIDFTDRMHPMIKGILCYLASGQDFTGQYWLNAVRSNNDYPHAPWWHTDSDSTCHHTYNPTACLAGFIIRFADQDSQLYRLGCRIAEEAIAALQCDSSHDMHTTLCYIRLLQYCEEAGVSHLFSLPALKEKLKLRVNASITRNTAAWDTGYVCRPSQYFKTKGSLFYPENSEIANYECEHIIKSQLEDGSWNIPWHWEAYPEAWSISKNWWKANGALHNMLYLQGMGKLAGGSE